MDKAIIGAILKRRIKEKGYTQEEFAELCGIGFSSLKKYMNGQNAYSYEILDIFADKLECSYDYLLGKSKVAKRKYQDMRNETRLSIKAIDILKEYAKNYDNDVMSRKYIDMFTGMIEDELYHQNLLSYVYVTEYELEQMRAIMGEFWLKMNMPRLDSETQQNLSEISRQSLDTIWNMSLFSAGKSLRKHVLENEREEDKNVSIWEE